MKKTTAVEAFAALGHDTRLAIYRLLVEAGPDGMAAGDIAAVLDIQPSKLAFHTGSLARAGLIGSERDGRHIFYMADFHTMGELVDFLTQKCCGGHPEVCRNLPARRTAKAS